MTDEACQQCAPLIPLTAVVLAAGSSQRMGRAKLLIPLKGRPLFQHVVDQVAASRLREIVLVVGSEADEILAALEIPRNSGLRVVRNEEFAQGQGLSLRTGLLALGDDSQGAAIFLADQPGIAPALIDELAEAFLAGTALALRPVYEGEGGDKVPSHPVFLCASVIREVLDEIKGDTGLRGILGEHPDWLREVAVPGQAPQDIDTPEDLEAYLGQASD
ncbi:MAG: nucleotidyltransferase family protein [Deltaproteobacteria bacterium]|nr:nucleotidyltransferase family protein [Deltaproteobacteria bacterium]